MYKAAAANSGEELSAWIRGVLGAAVVNETAPPEPVCGRPVVRQPRPVKAKKDDHISKPRVCGHPVAREPKPLRRPNRTRPIDSPPVILSVAEKMSSEPPRGESATVTFVDEVAGPLDVPALVANTAAAFRWARGEVEVPDFDAPTLESLATESVLLTGRESPLHAPDTAPITLAPGQVHVSEDGSVSVDFGAVPAPRGSGWDGLIEALVEEGSVVPPPRLVNVLPLEELPRPAPILPLVPPPGELIVALEKAKDAALVDLLEKSRPQVVTDLETGLQLEVQPEKPKRAFKRHPKCVCDKCERFQSAACQLCYKINAITF